MSNANQVPYTWEEIDLQVRRSIAAMADILSVFGPEDGNELLDAFLGCDTSEIQFDQITDEQLASFNASRHGIYRLAKKAYDYAYQLEGAELVTGDDWYEASALLEPSYAQIDRHGEPSPLYAAWDQPLRRVIETFAARWDLNNHGGGQSVRQLALLANMSLQAVRNSLSKEGFKLELKVSGRDDDQSFELPAQDALVWLSKRRGYIPNRTGVRMDDPGIAVAETLNKGDLGFPAMLDRIIKITRNSVEELAAASGTAKEWIERLLDGSPVDVDLSALVALGRALGADPAKFAGRGVEYCLSQTAI